MRISGSAPGMTQRMKRLWPFLLWLAVFYGVWLFLVVTGGHWDELREHWGIAVAMALGSYVAGSTPMGGGPSMARNAPPRLMLVR